MNMPPYPWWFWTILLSPGVIWLGLWLLVLRTHISLKRISPWLRAGFLLSLPAYLVVETAGGHRFLRLTIAAFFYTCMNVSIWIDSRHMLETIGEPRSKWHLPWNSARFSIPRNARVLVRDINVASSWYEEKLGLEKAAENPWAESEASTYKFREGGKSITLTTRPDRTDRSLLLFAKNLQKMQRVILARGISPGLVREDRQGTRFFEIHDPEGNTIEVVEDR